MASERQATQGANLAHRKCTIVPSHGATRPPRARGIDTPNLGNQKALTMPPALT